MAAKRAEWRPGGGGVREIGWQVHGHPRAGGLGGSGWGFLGAAVHGRRQKSAWLSPTGGVRKSKTEISVEDTRYAGASAYWVTYGGWGIALRVLVMGGAPSPRYLRTLSRNSPRPDWPRRNTQRTSRGQSPTDTLSSRR